MSKLKAIKQIYVGVNVVMHDLYTRLFSVLNHSPNLYVFFICGPRVRICSIWVVQLGRSHFMQLHAVPLGAC